MCFSPSVKANKRKLFLRAFLQCWFIFYIVFFWELKSCGCSSSFLTGECLECFWEISTLCQVTLAIYLFYWPHLNLRLLLVQLVWPRDLYRSTPTSPSWGGGNGWLFHVGGEELTQVCNSLYTAFRYSCFLHSLCSNKPWGILWNLGIFKALLKALISEEVCIDVGFFLVVEQCWII